MNTLTIPDDLLAAMRAHAENEYPRECCGLGTAAADAPDELLAWHPCRNAQDEFHAHDPARFPRTSANAYFIHPAELFNLSRQADQRGEILRLIVHSHCDAPVCFSAEDHAQALFAGEPLYPRAEHLVIAVINGKVTAMGCFGWQPEGGFVGRPL